MKLLNKLSLIALGFATTIAVPLHAEEHGKEQAQVMNAHFKKGEVMCLVSSVSWPDNQAIKQTYFQGVLPVASEVGFQFMFNLKVDTQLDGTHKAPAFGLIKLPSTQAKLDLLTIHLPKWQKFREMRPDVWQSLVQREYEIQQTTNFSYDSKKYYQVETFWLQDDKADEFANYRMARQSYHTKLNGRIFFESNTPSHYETLGTERAPSHTIITEWDNKAQFETYNQLAETKPFKYLAGYNAWLMTTMPSQS